jgi:hypothetical protein
MQTSIANELQQIAVTVTAALRRIDDSEAALSREPGKWSRKQIVGHLIDSAANNHHRFIRAQEGTELVFPKYEQEHWVAVQGYGETPWEELIVLWGSYNRHLARVIAGIPSEKLAVVCRIGPYEPVTLRFLVEDYLVHLKKHLTQLGLSSGSARGRLRNRKEKEKL